MAKLTSWAMVLVLATAGVSAACGGSAAPAEAPSSADESGGEESASEGASDDDAPVKFDEMSPPQKMAHMKKVVVPTMAKVFQSADADEYADFGCTSCHGPGAKNGNFQMPSPDLPKLTMAEVDWEAPVVKFMAEQVVPQMAKTLGEEPYNPETHEGFGCAGCHVTE